MFEAGKKYQYCDRGPILTVHWADEFSALTEWVATKHRMITRQSEFKELEWKEHKEPKSFIVRVVRYPNGSIGFFHESLNIPNHCEVLSNFEVKDYGKGHPAGVTVKQLSIG